jgi:hypothetical protein
MAPSVLVADADRDLCDLYRGFLSHHGWQVRTSGTGLDCLAQLRQSLPHFLVLDMHLPWGGADGLLAVMRDDPVSPAFPSSSLPPGPPRRLFLAWRHRRSCRPCGSPFPCRLCSNECYPDWGTDSRRRGRKAGNIPTPAIFPDAMEAFSHVPIGPRGAAFPAAR